MKNDMKIMPWTWKSFLAVFVMLAAFSAPRVPAAVSRADNAVIDPATGLPIVAGGSAGIDPATGLPRGSARAGAEPSEARLQQALSEAREFMKRGHYEEALERFTWYYNNFQELSARPRAFGLIGVLLEVLVGSGHKTEAEKIRSLAVARLDDPRLEAAVEDAERRVARP